MQCRIITLRRSRFLLLATVAMAACLASAIWLTVMPFYGAPCAVLAACACVAVFGLHARAAFQRAAQRLELGPPGQLTIHFADAPQARRATVRGVLHWPSLLLALDLQVGSERRAVLVCGDAIPPIEFHRLCVWCKQARSCRAHQTAGGAG